MFIIYRIFAGLSTAGYIVGARQIYDQLLTAEYIYANLNV